MLSDLLSAAVKLQEKPQTASGKIDLQKSSGYNTHRFGRMPVFVLQGVSALRYYTKTGNTKRLAEAFVKKILAES